MSSSELVAGIVKWFDPTKGYGFAVHDGKDVFLHSKRLRESGISVSPDPATPTLNPGDKLKFKVESGPKGHYATTISKV
jgi:CspA family cold shock protein